MNQPIAILLGAAVVAAASAFAGVRLSNDNPPPAPVSADQDLAPRLDTLQQVQEETARTLRALAERLDAVDLRSGRIELPAVSDEQVQRALEVYFEKARAQGASLPVPAAATAAAASGGDGPPLTVEQVLAELDRMQIEDHDEGQVLWGKAAKAGILDDLVAAYEARAKQNPNDASARSDLGNAYLQKLFTVGNGPDQGTWAVKADKTFDEALDIDPGHWEARFSKATSLAFWPPILGKGGEAAKHYEILLEQQEASRVKKPEYAQTYVFLGNLYDQRGDKEKAKETWRKGYALYPESPELRGKTQ